MTAVAAEFDPARTALLLANMNGPVYARSILATAALRRHTDS